MIYLTKGQALFDNPGMVVYDQTGYYDDGTSILCAASYAPEEPLCRYEAKFIAYGDLVYKITDPEKLMEEVIKIDPKSLYGKDSRQVAVDNTVEKIVPQNSEVIETTEKSNDLNENESENTITNNNQNSTTTSALPSNENISDNTTSTTTPAIDLDSEIENNTTSTTTPEIVLPDGLTGEDLIIPEEMPTSTPTVTTPEILFSEETNPIQTNIGNVTE